MEHYQHIETYVWHEDGVFSHFRFSSNDSCLHLNTSVVRTELYLKEKGRKTNPFSSFLWDCFYPLILIVLFCGGFFTFLSTLATWPPQVLPEIYCACSWILVRGWAGGGVGRALFYLGHKLPETLRICQYCCSNLIENEMHFLFHCDRYNNIRQQVTNGVIKKYPKFDSFTEHRENNIFI